MHAPQQGRGHVVKSSLDLVLNKGREPIEGKLPTGPLKPGANTGYIAYVLKYVKGKRILCLEKIPALALNALTDDLLQGRHMEP